MRSNNAKFHPSIATKYAFLIAAALFTLDQITKYIIKIYVSPLDVIRVFPFFSIVYVENTGSAFGMLKGMGNMFFIVFSFAAIGFVSYFILKDKENRLAFSFILGGAAGNLTDRIIYGYVIDFLDIYFGSFHWPAFNVADSALTVGLLLIIINIFTAKRQGSC